MSSLATRLSDLATAIATDVKLLRTYITGSSTGDLSGLTTTAKSSVIAAINEVKASATGAPPASTETASGVAELATTAETIAGTDDLRIVTPLKDHNALVAYAQPLDSDLTSIAALTTTAYGRAFLALVNQAGLQALLGLSTDGTMAGNSDLLIPTQKAAKAYADGLLDANNAYQYKGVVDASTSPNYPAASAGWTYKISVAGKIGGVSGLNVEIGDSITCITDGTAAGTQAAVGANWIVMQTNVDGGVIGPASTVGSDLAMFSGTTGKLVADSGVSISTDGTLATNNNTKVPTEGAIRTYLTTLFGNPDTDLASAYNAAKV